MNSRIATDLTNERFSELGKPADLFNDPIRGLVAIGNHLHPLPHSTSTTVHDLYPRLLGDSWDKLSKEVRSAHTAHIEKRGRFQITNGDNYFVRSLIRLSGLPQKSDDTEVTLTIHPDCDGEKWERRFGFTGFTTTQRASSNRLVERMGNWELSFALRVVDGSLEYEQCGASLCVGSARLPLPRALAPRVRAREQARMHDQVHVHVSVCLPWLGPLITYEGLLGVGIPLS